MGRVDEQRLKGMALAALEEVAARCRHAPQPKTRAVALALAYLAWRSTDPEHRHVAKMDARAGTPGNPFALFWVAMAHARPNDRGALIEAALNGIYLAVGIRRDVQKIGTFEREAARLASR